MDYVVYYEMVSFIVLVIVYGYYLFRNWLDLRRNRSYYVLLLMVILATGVDLAGRILFLGTNLDVSLFAMLVSTMANIGLLLICTELYAYFCSLVQCRSKAVIWLERAYRFIAVLWIVGMLYNCHTNFLFWYDISRKYHTTNMVYILILFEELCLLTGAVVLMRERHHLMKLHRLVILIATILFIMALVPLQNLIPTKFRMTYYFLSCILSVYYFMFHMADQHLRRRSSCFSNVGMRQVVEEREIYQENFVCVAVNITNIFSILSVCSEEEMHLFDQLISRQLNSISKQCVVFQTHNSEYMLMCKDEKSADANGIALRESMPAVLRIHDRNISVSYGYYMVSFEDAAYREPDFYRIIARMRRMVKEVTDHRNILYYEGEIKERLQQELEGIQRMNEILEAGRGDFGMDFIPIYSTDHSGVKELEVESYLCLQDGQRIPETELWKLAEERGNSGDMALHWWRQVLDYVQELGLFTRGISLLHINVTPLQIRRQNMIDQFCGLLEERKIRPGQIAVEVAVDQSVPEDILQKSLNYMQQKGFCVLLDQFGVNICNLKNILDMPFNQVKMNVQLTKRLLIKKQDELRYIVHMLRRQDWENYLDGVDRMQRSDELREIGVDKMQGEHIGTRISAVRLEHWLDEKGGEAS